MAPITSCENSSSFALPFGRHLRKSRHISSATMIKRLHACHRYVTTTSGPLGSTRNVWERKNYQHAGKTADGLVGPLAPTARGRCTTRAPLSPLARAWEICSVGGPLESESDGKPGLFCTARRHNVLRGETKRELVMDSSENKQWMMWWLYLFWLMVHLRLGTSLE